MRAHIIGGSGYAGGELLRILAMHPGVTGLTATSRTYEGKKISFLHPNLKGFVDGVFLSHDADLGFADFVFTALPHGMSMNVVPGILDAGCRVVDLSADYRICDRPLYERHYCEHTSFELVDEAVYGLPEIFRKDIMRARLCANPGCYATAAILSLAPLSGLCDLSQTVVDATSGTSGAGAGAKRSLLYSEVCEDLRPYNVTGHRHEPEMNHILGRLDPSFDLCFTPSIAPTIRGILSKAHVLSELDFEEAKKAFEKAYSDEAFVRIAESASTKDVLRTNMCEISLHAGGKRTVIVSAIDNLVKGAAGQAVQNMNLMAGFGEAEGLERISCHP